MAAELGEGVPLVTLRPPKDCERLYSPAMTAVLGLSVVLQLILVVPTEDGSTVFVNSDVES